MALIVATKLRGIRSLGAPAANMAMRAAILVGRFGLTLYIARYIGLRAVGEYGLVQGLSGAMPAFIGLGLNYFVSREIIGASKEKSGRLIRDRIVVTMLMLVLALPVEFEFASKFGEDRLLVYLLPIIVAGECIAFDFHMSLIGLRMLARANFLAFVRSASWTFPVVAIGLALPTYRALDVVLGGWCIGLALNFFILAILFKDWPLRSIFSSPIDFAWLISTIKNGMLIYLNDVGIVGQVFADRYLVAFFLGIGATGLYTLFWSVGNSAYTLVYTSLVQMSLPELVTVRATRGEQGWYLAFKKELVKSGAVALGVGAVVAVTAIAGAPFVHLNQFRTGMWIFLGILFGAVLKLVSDIFNYGLYSRRLDKSLAYINLFGMVLSLTLSTVGIAVMGLAGVAFSALGTPAILFCLRRSILFADYRKSVSPPAEAAN
jgi:O-antigen/teichoic acid export membrane protein